MLKVSNDHLSAHEHAQRNRAEVVSIEWYRNLGEKVPQGSDADMQNLILRARETASVIGLADDETYRLRRLMVMHALMPKPNDEQWLLSIDAVFDEPTQDDAISTLLGLANQPS